MKKQITLLFFFCLSIIQICQAQPGNHTVGLKVYDPSLAFEGYNLHFPHNQGNTYLLNNCGEIVHKWTDATFKPGNGVRLRENGNLYVTKGKNALSNSFIHAGGGGEKVEIRDWDNTLLWTYTINDSTQRMHHDIDLLPNGNILAIVWDYKTDAEAIAAGRNPAKLTGSGALGNGLWPEKIIELQPDLVNGTTQIVWQWNVWDHMIQDHDSTKANYGNVAAHPELIDLNYTLYDSTADWQHANSINYNPSLDQIMLSVPTFNEIWIIDHSTTTAEAAGHTGGLVGAGGDLIYRFGNPSAYRAPGTTKLFYQHDAHWVDINIPSTNPEFGKIVVFNNKVGPDYSTAHTFSPAFDTYEWEYPRDTNGVWGPNSFDWTYIATPPQQMYSTGLGAIQVLPNGNRLINEGREGRAFEVTNQGQIVWEYVNPMKNGNPVAQYDSTLTPSINQQFRFTRYPVSYPAFNGRNLTPQGYIELNPDTVFCSLILDVETIVDGVSDFKVYPNPARGEFMVEFEANFSDERRIEIFDMYGRRIHTSTCTEQRLNIDLSAYNSGIYVLRIDEKSQAKIILMK
jgi:hypothetical protein